MQIHVHFMTAGAGGSGKSFMALCALSHFIQHSKDHPGTHDRVVLIDGNDKNHDLYEVWLKNFAVSEATSDTSTSGVVFEKYKLSDNHNFPIEIVRIDKFNWQWVQEFTIAFQANLPAISTLHLIIDTDNSPSQLYEQLDVMDFSQGNNYFIYPWLLWTNNIFPNQRFISETKSLLEKQEQEITEKGGNLIPIHVFNPILSDTNTNGWQGFRRPRRETIGSYNIYRNCVAGSFISIPTFFNLAYSYFPLTSSVPEQEKEVYEQTGKMLHTRCRTRDQCSHKDELCRYANIFCIANYDRELGTLKTVPRVARELAETANIKATSVPSPIPAIMMLPEVLDTIAKEVHQNLNGLYQIVSQVYMR